MKAPPALANAVEAIVNALDNPIEQSLATIAKTKLAANKDKQPSSSSVTILVHSYKGEGNILTPIIQVLFDAGYKADAITVLVSTERTGR